MSDRLRLAVCGLGLAGMRHADAMARVPEADLAAVVEPDDERAAAATPAGTARCASLESLLEDGEVDGVVLATPTPLHVEQALACVRRGCPVLVEKPVADSSADAELLVREAAGRGVAVLVGHHRRHNPLVLEAGQVIESGAVGEIRGIQATCWLYKPDSYFGGAPWRSESGAGPILVNLIHDIDILRHLCGEVAAVQAAATPSLRGHGNEDMAGAVLEFASGAVGTVSVSDGVAAPWSWELTARENPVYPSTPESCYLIGGSRGSISLPDLRVWSHPSGTPDWWTPIAAASLARRVADPLVEQMRHFCRVVRGEAAPLVSAREGMLSLRVAEAVLEAARTGRRVVLPAEKPSEKVG